MRRGMIMTIVTTITAGVLVIGTAGAFWLLRTEGDPRQVATDFLAAWERADHAAMRRLVADPPADLAGTYTSLAAGLGVTATEVRLTSLKPGDPRRASFTAALTLRTGGTWTYDGELTLTDRDREWRVDWTPAAVHPKLSAGERFTSAATWPRRGAVKAADGSRIDGGDVPGSVQQLAGTLAPAGDADVRRLGAPYRKGDRIGKGGVQEQLERTLAGVPDTTVQLVPAAGGAAETIGRIEGRAGGDVETSLDPRVQAAAAKAITRQRKPAALVAVRPSTGEILAAANQPGGFSRALLGRYPPGSTFKVVTTAALLSAGLPPTGKVDCTKTALIGGRSFRNFEDEAFGPQSFRSAFAHSCNTVFATEVTRRLKPEQLIAAARDFGFGVELKAGVPAARGVFPRPADTADFAAASFGQGRVLASPLTMASVAAAVRDGSWRSPVLVRPAGGEPEQRREGQNGTVRRLPGEVVAGLRPMMADVVTKGTAKGAGLPRGTAGKTGTAEFGAGAEPPTHAWFIGYRGDLAFAVIIEDGGTGGAKAAPMAAAFLKAL